MNLTIARVRMVIAQGKAKLDQEKDSEQRQKITRGIEQFDQFQKILLRQLANLIKIMDTLPTGSVKAEFEKLIKMNVPNPDSPYIRILLKKSGEIRVDGELIDLDALKIWLAPLAEKHGVVLYTREDPQDPEPPATAKQVINLVIQHHLPIRLCLKSDFSDGIDAEGKLRTGKP